MERIRIASLPYFIRPVQTFEQFRDQVESLVETAADYGCHLLVFPEYFTVQLLTLGNVRRPIREQIRDLADQVPRTVDLTGSLAKRKKLYIAAGTVPVCEGDKEKVYNQSFFFGPSGDHGVRGSGKIADPTLTFQLKHGFEVIAVVSGYLRNDPESRGYAAVIEWINDQVAKPEHLARRSPRFPRSHPSAQPL